MPTTGPPTITKLRRTGNRYVTTVGSGRDGRMIRQPLYELGGLPSVAVEIGSVAVPAGPCRAVEVRPTAVEWKYSTPRWRPAQSDAATLAIGASWSRQRVTVA